MRGPWEDTEGHTTGSPQDAPTCTVMAKCCSWIWLSTEQNNPSLGGLPLLQLCKCVFVSTPRFAQEHTALF